MTAIKRQNTTLALVALLVLVSSLVGRAFAPALPGTLTGISGWIGFVHSLDSFLAQLFAVSGLFLVVRLVGVAVRSDDTDLLFKIVVLPMTALVGFVVISKMRVNYVEPASSLVVSLASGCLALAATPRLLRSITTRAAGLALGITGLSSLLHAAGRMLALQANFSLEPARFTLARSVETIGFVFGVLLLAVSAAWLYGKTRRGIIKLVGLAGVVCVLSYTAARGSAPNSATWEVLASRSIGHLLREPAPFLPDFIRSTAALLKLGLGVAMLATLRPAATRVLLCLCLISSGATDFPLLALALVLAALLGCTGLVRRAKTPSLSSNPESDGR